MNIAHKLREEGFKVTPQRIAIFEALYGHTEHPTAEMIYQGLRTAYPTMSLATVYKTMEIFEKIGIVRVLDVGDDCSRYDWDTHEHPHIRCIVCNKVEDLHDVDMTKIMADIAEAGDYEITGCQVSVTGICRQCAKKRSH